MSKNFVDLSAVQTEERNSRSSNIDKVTTEQLCRIINAEDATIPRIVGNRINIIAQAIDALADRVRKGGRVFYIGAGTSGRLGVLDASEIPPTFSVPQGQFVGLIAGGDVALRLAVEGAEDSPEACVADLEAHQLDGKLDSLIAIAASGRTPYVLGGLAFVKRKGCATVGIACSSPSAMSESGHVDFMINAVTGPEIVTGSTRMKAGTATKLVLNMISTGIMVKAGKTYGNIMIDVRPTNFKLQQRARRILREVCGDKCPTGDDELDDMLAVCKRNVKVTAVAIWFGIRAEEAEDRLRYAGGVLAHALELTKEEGVKGELRAYYLCVDGGGSKCSASITSGDSVKIRGLEAEGRSGSCNVTDVGVENAVSQIDLAVQEAINSHPRAHAIRQAGFSAVWVAIAGSDREGLHDMFHAKLTDRLLLAPGAHVRLTNDIDLLATNKFYQLDQERAIEVESVIIVVAGTGSVAMTFQRIAGAIVRTDRSGGWGALLGDDGSGLDIGRQAIRFALADLENRRRFGNMKDGSDQEPDTLNELTRVVLRQCASADNVRTSDILSTILMPEPDKAHTASEMKRRIASFAQPVFDACRSSSEARRIVESALRSLHGLVRNLIKKPIVAERTDLVLAGGLMNSATFAKELTEMLLVSGIKFRKVTTDVRPGSRGAEYLAATESHPLEDLGA